MPLKLLKHQLEPSQLVSDFIARKIFPINQGFLLIGQTGCGKTYAIADGLANAQKDGNLLVPDDSLKLYSILYLCPKNCIEQQRRVLARAGVKNFDVISSSALASSYGEMFITFKEEPSKNGKDIIEVPYWDVDQLPDLILVDEVQAFKNPESKRTRVLLAYLEAGGRIISFSATPFQKAIESKLVVCSANIVSQEGFGHWAKECARPKQPTDNSPAAIRRIKEDLQSRNAFYEIKGVRYPFKPLIRNRLFEMSDEKLVHYNRAMQEYHEEREKKGLWDIRNSHFYEWVAWNKLREKCEILRVEELALTAVEAYRNLGVSVIIASNFIPTLMKTWEVLTRVHGINKANISHLIGGMTDNQIQSSIDNFQEGRTEFFLTTLKSGGTGLSLHDEHPLTKPRFVVLPPTWSVFEMIQMLGRAQRITSRSQTIQEIVWFSNSIEMRVAERLQEKFSCLRELISRKESFIHDIFKDNMQEEELRKLENSLVEDGLKDNSNSDEDKDSEESIAGFDLGMLD